MKKLPIFITICAGLALLFSACKKTEENPQQVVQNKILGKWPLKYRVRTVTTNKFIIKLDTIIYNPVDTMIFATDGTVTVKRNSTIISTSTYGIDAAGENITFTGTTTTTQKFMFVRPTSIGLFISDNTTNVGGNEVRTEIEDQLVK